MAKPLIFLDANVLVGSLSRTLLILSAPLSDFQVTWSLYAEGEALRHQTGAATPINVLRQRHGWTLVPDGELPEPLVDTDPKDMPILSAATLAGAKFVVTENIADFGLQDLARLRLSAVHPDLFLSQRLTPTVYRQILGDLAATRSKEPKTAGGIHSVEVGGYLPRRATTMRTAFQIPPIPPHQNPPRLSFRGYRCVVCARPLISRSSLASGIGPECRRFRGPEKATRRKTIQTYV